MFVFFVFYKNVLIKSYSSCDDLSEFRILWPYAEWCKICILLRSLNVSHFGTVAATALKLWRRRHIQWHELPTEFHKSLPLSSEVVRGKGRHTDRKVISLAYISPLGRVVIYKCTYLAHVHYTMC
jgi:hypothetical protein